MCSFSVYKKKNPYFPLLSLTGQISTNSTKTKLIYKRIPCSIKKKLLAEPSPLPYIEEKLASKETLKHKDTFVVIFDKLRTRRGALQFERELGDGHFGSYKPTTWKRKNGIDPFVCIKCCKGRSSVTFTIFHQTNGCDGRENVRCPKNNCLRASRAGQH